VDNVEPAIAQASASGLLGLNGAGKTTLIEIMEGISPLTPARPLRRARRGRPLQKEAGIQFRPHRSRSF
jgi:ABC-type branched-subunit amino acid transport system ATPase component